MHCGLLLEHTVRLLKQTLGWTTPKIRTSQAADRWTWLMLAAYTQLRLARGHSPRADTPGSWKLVIDEPLTVVV